MKHFEALVLMIDITNNAQLPYQITNGNCFLYPKTGLCLLSMAKMAKMAKLGFGPTLAFYHSQKHSWRGR